MLLLSAILLYTRYHHKKYAIEIEAGLVFFRFEDGERLTHFPVISYDAMFNIVNFISECNGKSTIIIIIPYCVSIFNTLFNIRLRGT